MLDQALRKLQAEISATKGNNKDPVTVIGSFLMDHVRVQPEDVQKVMAEGKSIVGSWIHMQNEAKKQNKTALSPTAGFRIVLQYYGISVSEETPEPVAVPAIKTTLADLF